MITSEHAAAIIAATRDVARAEILPRFRGALCVDRKSHADDLVTEADRGAEAALTPRLQRILPQASIIGEEAISEDKSLLARLGDDQVVIIDPIDGTWNFAHGIGTFGVILAVLEHGQTVWGALYDPLGDDWIEAHRGQGAWFCKDKGRRQLMLGERAQSIRQVAGTLHANLYPSQARPVVWSLAPDLRRVSHLGCSAHEYRVMATGGIDLMMNYMMNPWDHAAGALIIEELGGTVRLLDGRTYAPTMTEGRLLVSTSAALWDEAAARLIPGLKAANDPLI